MEDDTLTTVFNETAIPQADKEKPVHVELFHGDDQVSIDISKLPFIIGREEETCDLVIDGEFASRHHCRLELKENQISLVDTSTNGTFIKIGRADAVRIHNDYFPIVGKGYIKLGEKIDLNDKELILFKVVIGY